MAASATFYLDAAETQAMSDGTWAQDLDLGTVNIPPSGTAYTSGVQVWLKNDGTTELQSPSISAVDGSGETATVYDDRVSFAPDSAGSPGTWGADGAAYAPANIAAGSTITFWVRTRADAGDTQPANPVNMSLQLDATSV